MNRRSGFTVVELAVTIIIIGIILTIGVISMRTTQANSRNKEREADVATIANFIESTYAREYKNGTTVINRIGSYPQRDIFYTANSSDFAVVFGDLPDGAMNAPNSAVRSFMANNNHYSQTGINRSNVIPQHSAAVPKDSYIYVPLTSVGGTTCIQVTENCRAFQIYYMLEGETEYRVLESKRK